MTVDTAGPSVFDAGLPTIAYDLTATPAQVYPELLAAQRLAPIALGPFGPEVLSYELVRTVLRDSRFQIPPGYILAVQGITSGPLWDKVVNSLLGMEGDQAPARPQRRVEGVHPASGRAPARHDRRRDRRNRRTDQPPGSLRRRHRHRAALPGAHHLRPARRAARRLATVRPLDGRDLQSLQHSPSPPTTCPT